MTNALEILPGFMSKILNQMNVMHSNLNLLFDAFKFKPIFSPQCVAPVLVSTSMTSLGVSRAVKSASEFAREALNTVGHSTYTSGCLSHALQVRGRLRRPSQRPLL